LPVRDLWCNLATPHRPWSFVSGERHVNGFTQPVEGFVSVATGIALAQDRGDWRVESACKDTDPDLFFPVGTTGPAIEQIEAAKAVCGICPVQSQCLEFALATNQDSGVWGGTSEDERRRLRRQWLARQRRAS
jgi:WhiB family redox-sensing transcriptional regulator